MFLQLPEIARGIYIFDVSDSPKPLCFFRWSMELTFSAVIRHLHLIIQPLIYHRLFYPIKNLGSIEKGHHTSDSNSNNKIVSHDRPYKHISPQKMSLKDKVKAEK